MNKIPVIYLTGFDLSLFPHNELPFHIPRSISKLELSVDHWAFFQLFEFLRLKERHAS